MSYSHIESSYPSSLARRGIIDKFILLSTYVLFFLLPWYLNGLGNTQPADIALFSAMIFLILNRGFYGLNLVSRSKAYAALIFFLVYAIVRFCTSIINEPNDASIHLLIENIYYLIMLISLVSIIFYFYATRTHQEFYRIMINCLIITMLLPLINLIIGNSIHLNLTDVLDDNSIDRAMLTFKNANQLGFFALTNLSIFFYISLYSKKQNIAINKLISLFIINVNFIFLLLSQSRAAAPAVILYALSYAFIFRIRLQKGLLIILWCLIFCLVLTLSAKMILALMLASRGSMTSWTSSGLISEVYDRAFQGASFNLNYFSYFLFGYGSETNPWRVDHLEFHNNFLSIFNQLGILGLILYSYLIFRHLIDLYKKNFIYIIPFLCYLFYSQLQYAFRTRNNWVFFAVLIFVILTPLRKNKNNLIT